MSTAVRISNLAAALIILFHCFGISIVKVEFVSLCLSAHNVYCLVCAVPSPPWYVTVMQLNAHQVLVSWQAPRSPNGTIVSYMVFQSPPVPPVQKLQTGSKMSFIMNGDYNANGNYSFWVSDIQVRMCVCCASSGLVYL